MNYIDQLIAQRNEAQAERQALIDGINEIRSYLTSDKFSVDNKVEARDVLNKLAKTLSAGIKHGFESQSASLASSASAAARRTYKKIYGVDPS